MAEKKEKATVRKPRTTAKKTAKATAEPLIKTKAIYTPAVAEEKIITKIDNSLTEVKVMTPFA